jgi:cytochrome d ubiquinol oxidase subunit II
MFAAIPFWYASLFSGYYLLMLLILVGLIIRGVSFEFRATHPNEKHKVLWGKLCMIGSFIVPFTLGMVFTSLIQGMPLDAQGNMKAGFFDYVNLLSVVGGVAMVLLCYLHGMNYLALRTEGNLRDRAKQRAKQLYPFLYLGEIIFAILLFIFTDFVQNRPVITILLLAVMVILTACAHFAIIKEKELIAFIASGKTFVVLVILLFQGLFPRVMIAQDARFDLLLKDATSSPYTLRTMTFITLGILPFVIGYTIWTYYVFRKRITSERIDEY